MIVLNLVPLSATNVRLPPDLREEVEEYKKKNQKSIESIAQAARTLIRIGLETEREKS